MIIEHSPYPLAVQVQVWVLALAKGKFPKVQLYSNAAIYPVSWGLYG